MLKDLLRILFPDLCIHCGTPLVGDEKYLCTHCLTEIAWTHQAAIPNNETELRLAGRIPCQAAATLMTFKKGSVAQSIVHHIKYHSITSLGIQYGRLLGKELKSSGRFNHLDYIVPVPLHWLRKMRRGYNQSELISKGIAQELGIPVVKRNLRRKKYTQTQTHKSRDERQRNMQAVFTVRNPELFQNKHILLVDDIITTGATTESCYQTLQSIANFRISVTALALVELT